MAKFKIKTQRARAKPSFVLSEKLRDPLDLPPYYIRGIQAGSKEEYWVSLALTRIQKAEGYTWQYQVPVYGGRQIAGGNVVDFIIYTPGQHTWLDPMGRYWHTGKNEDQLQMQTAARKSNARLIAWFTDETPTKEIMYVFLKNKLGL